MQNDTKNTLNHLAAVSILSQKQANRKRNNHTRFSDSGAERWQKGES